MLYQFICSNGHSMDVALRMANRNSLQECGICGNKMQRKISTGMAVIWQGRWHDQWRDKPGGEDDGLGPMTE